MGRKKSYSKNKEKPAAPPAAAPAGEGAAPGEAITGEVLPPVAAPAAEGEAAPQVILANRPEWALTVPVRLEQAEDETFWFAFALAVMACSPAMMSIPAALIAAFLGARIFGALWSVPSEVAPEDVGNARMLAMATAVLAALYKASQASWMPMVWMMVCVFFFNALRNVRVMVAVALKGGPKKKRREQRAEASAAAQIEEKEEE
jgi:hypothetical protein